MVYGYQIGADNRVIWVSDSWLDFARDNRASELTREEVVGRSLFSFISGAETEYLYYLILDEVRTCGATISVPFRCDGPTVRRFMRLLIRPLAGQAVGFEGRMIREEPRPPVSFLDAAVARTAAALTICGWCKRLQVGRDWLGLESAIETLDLFRSARLPQQNHGVCPACRKRVTRAVGVGGDS